MSIEAFAAFEPKQALKRFTYEPPELGAQDVEIAISHCGVCHTDLAMIDDHFFGLSTYPLVPGHEVIGTVAAKGAGVDDFAVGDRVGIGWLCSSCGQCEACEEGNAHLCPAAQGICVGRPGGFAERVRVDSRFVVAVPEGIESEQAAPLMCAGITVFAPLEELGVRSGTRVGVIGIGGLGHLAIQFARAFGCEVTALSGSPTKSDEARQLGAAHFVLTDDPRAFNELSASLDVLLATAEGNLPWETYLALLRPGGTLWLLGITEEPLQVMSSLLMLGRLRIGGSIIGSPSQMQRMLDFADRNRIHPWTRSFPLAEVNSALTCLRQGRLRYRAVLTT